ncbi:MAG: hypothetical protein LBH28_06440, partial [Oscillospiraceae bacterium]|nr:hypothetical protein [Oscillospiraceae bacterium]
KELSKTAIHAEREAIRRIRSATRELVLPLVKQYAEQGTIIYPTEELARRIDHIIREEGAKPVTAARKLQEEMEASLAEKLGIAPQRRQENQSKKRKNAKYADGDWKKYYEFYKAGVISAAQWRLFEKEYHGERPDGIGRQSFMPETYSGKGWGYGAAVQKPVGEIINMGGTLSGYYRDPQTGKIVWTDLPLEYQFRKRADLSTRVWKAVEEQERSVFDVVRGGISAGRDARHICGDLEQYINYPDGGKRVVGRWMGMFPDTEKGVKDAYMHQYIEDLGLQWGSPGAHNILYEKTPGGATRLREGFRQYLDERMAKVKFDEHGHAMRGSKLPYAVKQYATRLGKAGLDYRAISIARTEMTAMLADEQAAIAEDSSIATGEMDFVMDRGRDHWGCQCEHYAEQNPWKVDDPDRPEIPVHPNCMCGWRPRLKTDEEIIAAFKEEMKEDLEAVEGTDWQKEFIERLDTAEGRDTSISVAMPGFPDDKTPAIKIERGIVDYSGLTHNEAIRKEAAFINRLGTEKKHEIVTLISRDSNSVLGSWEGSESKTNIVNVEYRNASKGALPGSLDLIHCHSRGTLFADDDMNTICRKKELRNIMVTFPDNEIYALSVGDGHRPTKKVLDNVWSVIYGSLELEEKQKLGVNELLPEHKKEIINEVCRRMVSMYGWKLEKI